MNTNEMMKTILKDTESIQTLLADIGEIEDVLVVRILTISPETTKDLLDYN